MGVRIFLFIILMSIINIVDAQTKKDAVTVKFTRNADKSVDFFYEKSIPGSVFLKITFTSLGNASAGDYEQVLTFPSGSLTRLTPIFPEQDINFQYKFSYTKGNPKAKIDSTFQYILPFKKGKKVQVFEAKNLYETHFGSKKQVKWKSYFVKGNNPDTVCAMRKGIVVEVVNEYSGNTADIYQFTSKQNHILVEHPDGSFATYKGFKKDAFFIKLGEVVYPNTPLGILALFDGKDYNLHFNVSYLKPSEINFNATMNAIESPHDYLTPYFITAEGNQKLENEKTYTTDLNEAVIQKEFTKKEIKKLKKS